MEKAVVDRIIGQMAVLLVGDEEEEIVLPLSLLPQGIGEGGWLQLERKGKQVINIRADQEMTAQRADHIADRLERLRKQMRSRYKK
jgi:hypothetical protein